MKLLNAQDTAEKIGKAKSTFFNYVTDGYFPQPKKTVYPVTGVRKSWTRGLSLAREQKPRYRQLPLMIYLKFNRVLKKSS